MPSDVTKHYSATVTQFSSEDDMRIK